MASVSEPPHHPAQDACERSRDVLSASTAVLCKAAELQSGGSPPGRAEKAMGAASSMRAFAKGLQRVNSFPRELMDLNEIGNWRINELLWVMIVFH